MAFPAHPGGEGNETDPLSAARGRPHMTAAVAEDGGSWTQATGLPGSRSPEFTFFFRPGKTDGRKAMQNSAVLNA